MRRPRLRRLTAEARAGFTHVPAVDVERVRLIVVPVLTPGIVAMTVGRFVFLRRGHETDADLVGMELAARAGYDPRAAAEVWRKMAALGAQSGNPQPPQFLSTHPAHATRIREIEANLARVLPLYRAARNAAAER